MSNRSRPVDSSMKIQVAQKTHIGMHRSENQDSMNFVRPEDLDLLNTRGCLLIIADGMGGAAGGKTASSLATTVISGTYFNSGGDSLESLQQAFETANTEIFSRSQLEPRLAGMGTTATAIVFLQGRYISAHVGDTRLYRLRDHSLERLTSDHSMVAQMVREGLIQDQDARHHPQKNILLRSMGIEPHLNVDFQNDSLATGDVYLLCSDGLHGLVDDREIASALQDHPPEKACERLIALANERGGFDNITVQIARIEAVDPES